MFFPELLPQLLKFFMEVDKIVIRGADDRASKLVCFQVPKSNKPGPECHGIDSYGPNVSIITATLDVSEHHRVSRHQAIGEKATALSELP